MIYGYARVSTSDQTVDSQSLVLSRAGVEATYHEVISGSVPALARPVLSDVLARMVKGDVLAVARLDRLGRDPADTLWLLRDLDARGIGVLLLDLGADTSTPSGRLVVGVIAAVAGWERDLLRERTRAGLDAARARGELLGRRHSLSPYQRAEAARLAQAGQSVSEVAKLLGVARSVAHRAMRQLSPSV